MSHILRFTNFPATKNEPRTVYINYGLNSEKSFFKRVWIAFLYLLNKDTFDGYDEVMLGTEKTKEIILFLQNEENI